MNERLKELYSDSAIYAFDQRFIPGPVRELQEVITEKFAELIIKECAHVLELNAIAQQSIETVEMTHHNKSQDWMDGYKEGTREYGSFLLAKNANLLKKNFGIEK